MTREKPSYFHVWYIPHPATTFNAFTTGTRFRGQNYLDLVLGGLGALKGLRKKRAVCTYNAANNPVDEAQQEHIARDCS